jgi:putative phosphoribosyl transferase
MVDMDSSYEYIFKDRDEAYRDLEELIPKDVDFGSGWTIITVSIDNIPKVTRISLKLKTPLKPLLLHEIYAPNNKECSIAIVSETEEIVFHKRFLDSFEIGQDYIYDMAKKIYENDILNQLYSLKGAKEPLALNEKNVMIFSDGCESGLHILCAIKSLLNLGVKRIYLFTPVISEDLYMNLDKIVDRVFTKHILKDFVSVDSYFEDFSSVDIELLGSIYTNKSNIAEIGLDE